MRKLMWLVTLIATMPLSSWANSRLDVQNFQDKSHFGGDVFSTRTHGSNYSGIQGVSGASFGAARLGSVALTTHKFDGSFRQSGVWTDGKSDDRISLAGKRHNLGYEHSKGGDDDRGDDGGGIALPVPEPGTLSLLGAGLVALAGIVRRRRIA